MDNNERIIPSELEFFLKQESRFFINAESTKRTRWMLRIYLETLLNHPSSNPYEQLLIQTVKTQKVQGVHDPILQRLLKKIVNDHSPHPLLPILNEFEEIALDWDYHKLESRIDLLVSYPIDSVRDPLTLMLGGAIRTRKGLHPVGEEPFIAADPIEVKWMLENQPKKFPSDKIPYWLNECSGRFVEYLSMKVSQNARA